MGICAYSRSSKSAEWTPRARGDMKRETKLLHSRLDGPGETKPLAVVNPKEILVFDRSIQFLFGCESWPFCEVSLLDWPRELGVAATGYIIEASRSNYLPGWHNHKTSWPSL